MKRRAGESFTIGDDIEIEVLENITAARSLDPQAIADLVHRLWRQTKTRR
jgi:hypothetical protein